MDFIIKVTIGLFIFSIFLLFFKTTKKVSLNYYKIPHKEYQKEINNINEIPEIIWKIKK
jgi:hypothetical protein